MARALPQPGEIIADKYLVTGLIGRGGMGAVYVVEHRLTHKRLAVKCLLPEHTEHPELVERFLREAQAAGRIQNRYVVDVFDVGRDGELLYIVMELLDGKQLGDLLRDMTLPVEAVLVILLRAMEGVAAAHAEGIVHRDLKPENILVCTGQSGKLDDPRVLDFGISKLEADASLPLTRSGMMMGTPYYMSFEQINSQRDLDQRVDVYAMGVIFYEALSGRVPYIAESVGALAVQMMSGPPTPLSELRPDLAPELVAVVMRSIARDRDERYPSMRALIEALEPFVVSDPASTPARGSTPMRAASPAYSSLRLTGGDAPTLMATPTRTDGMLRVDEDDESSRPAPSGSQFPVGKVLLVLASTLVLAAATIGIWRGSHASSEPATATPAAPSPVGSAEPGVPAGGTEDPLPPSAAPIKGTASADEEPARVEPGVPAEVLLDGGTLPMPALEEAEDEGARKRGKKPKKKRAASLTLDQMVPQAPALPLEEREPAAVVPSPAAAPVEVEKPVAPAEPDAPPVETPSAP